MPKRRKKVEEPTVEEKEETVEEKAETTEATTEEQTSYNQKVEFGEPFKPTEEEIEEAKKPESSPSDIVKVEVVRGSLGFEGKTYEKGETFETTLARALSIDQNFVKIYN